MAGFIELPETSQENHQGNPQQRFEVIRRAGKFEQSIEVVAVDSGRCETPGRGTVRPSKNGDSYLHRYFTRSR